MLNLVAVDKSGSSLFLLSSILIQGVLFLLIIIPGVSYGLWKRRRMSKSDKDSFVPGPILLSLYSLEGGIEPITKGKIGQWPYQLFMTGVTMPPTMGYDDKPIIHEYRGSISDATESAAGEIASTLIKAADHPARVFLLITMPTKSPVHIAAVGHEAGSADLDPRLLIGNGMVPARLEGNFPDYFRLYCDQTHQLELRQLLDPATMAFLVDYCQEYDWEVEGEYLYIVERDNARRTKNDKTTITEDAETLVKKLSPTLKRLSKTNSQEGTALISDTASTIKE